MASLGAFTIRPISTALNGVVLARIREYRPSITLSLCAFMLFCSLLLGGGTHGGYLSDPILELIAIPVLLLTLSSLANLPIWQSKSRGSIRYVLKLCCVIALVPLIQLVPLPPWIWTSLPGREQMVTVFKLLGDQIPWMPISVAPQETWSSFLSLLPPMATFLLTIQLSYRERRGLSLVMLAMGVGSAFLGLVQVSQGRGSLLQFFSGNEGEAAGFFANRNHFAAFLYSVLLFTAVWAIDVGFRIRSWREAAGSHTGIILELTATFMIFIAVIAVEAMVRSRAGLLLTIVALVAVFALAFRDDRNFARSETNKPRGKVSQIVFAATIVAIILPVQFTLYRIMDRFAEDPLAGARIVFARNTITAAKVFMPFGAGIGTFVPIYQLVEQPSDTIANIYANRAHNDFLEIWLESGVIGPALLLVFVVWLGYTSVKLWRRQEAAVNPFDTTLARAATVVIALLLAHSLVDYPIRTEAIMAVFAMCCALMIEPVKDGDDAAKFAASLERYLVRRKPQPEVKPTSPSAPVSPVSSPAPIGQAQSQQATGWGDGIDWPDEWRKPGGSSGGGTDGAQ
jgi:O-antigen ligase